jgi:hypothetical protein
MKITWNKKSSIIKFFSYSYIEFGLINSVTIAKKCVNCNVSVRKNYVQNFGTKPANKLPCKIYKENKYESDEPATTSTNGTSASLANNDDSSISALRFQFLLVGVI